MPAVTYLTQATDFRRRAECRHANRRGGPPAVPTLSTQHIEEGPQ